MHLRLPLLAIRLQEPPIASRKWADRLLSGIGLCFLTTACSVSGARAEEHPGFNVHEREHWTSSRIVGRPDPPDAYTTELAFPKLKFVEPLSMCLVPGSNRLCVATRSGKIFTFENQRDVAEPELLIDLKKQVYGVAFHPNFVQNGYFYVTNFSNPSAFDETGAHLSRFTADLGRTLTADRNSEQLILTWPSGGHNGGCVRFGPNGYLYIATGDSSGIADALLTGQNISDLSGSILRIDVDRSSQDKPYSIPPDNPFVDTPNARGEIWSYGHRQVWKFSFDQHHRLWAGDVGQDLWEAIYLVQRGGNYGWSIQEAGQPFRPDRPRGPSEILPPLVKHSHGEFRSVTGGYVSQTPRLPELDGSYIYGDYDTGKIWSLKLENGREPSPQELADTELRIVEFAQDNAGEVLVVDFVGGAIHRLVPSPPLTKSTPAFPRKLSETGLFRSTEKLVPAQGLIPYSVNAALWSDGAAKERFIAIPHDSQIEMDAIFYPHRPDYPDRGWRFPDGTVLVKTFSIAMDTSRPDELRRLETRIMHFRQMPGNDDEYGAQVWNGYTYVWNAEQTDAELLDASGKDIELSIADARVAGGVRKQTWHFPSRAECAICHTMGAKYALGVTTLQMNKVHDYGGHRENQLSLLERLGVFTERLPAPPDQLPALVDYRDAHQPLNLRARAYLHANCAHCHRKWGGGNAEFELQASIPISQTATLDTLPGQGTFGLNDPRILVPGQPQRSLIFTRMTLPGLGRMPHIGVSVVDEQAVGMLHEWISSLQDRRLLSQPGALRPRLPHPDATEPNPTLRLSSLLICMVATLLLVKRWFYRDEDK